MTIIDRKLSELNTRIRYRIFTSDSMALITYRNLIASVDWS